MTSLRISQHFDSAVCAYCGHTDDKHYGGTDEFPDGCMYFGEPDAYYGDAENCAGHCMCPEFEPAVAQTGDER